MTKLNSLLPHTFNVLDWFHITDIWCEKQTAWDPTKLISFWKIRLEKIDLDSPGWWTPKNYWKNFQPGDVQPRLESCAECEQESQQIFRQIWTCLNKQCKDFFRFPPHTNISELEYADSFVNKRARFDGQLTEPLVPQQLQAVPTGKCGTEKELRVGLICPQCRCCSRRFCWTRWQCENKFCSYVMEFPLMQYPIDEVLGEEKTFTEKHRKLPTRASPMLCLDLIQKHEGTLGGYQYQQYFLPGLGDNNRFLGAVTVFRADCSIRENTEGPNDLWKAIQDEDHDLQRLPVRMKNCKYC